MGHVQAGPGTRELAHRFSLNKRKKLDQLSFVPGALPRSSGSASLRWCSTGQCCSVAHRTGLPRLSPAELEKRVRLFLNSSSSGTRQSLTRLRALLPDSPPYIPCAIPRAPDRKKYPGRWHPSTSFQLEPTIVGKSASSLLKTRPCRSTPHLLLKYPATIRPMSPSAVDARSIRPPTFHTTHPCTLIIPKPRLL